jgi:hypothetical protein
MICCHSDFVILTRYVGRHLQVFEVSLPIVSKKIWQHSSHLCYLNFSICGFSTSVSIARAMSVVSSGSKKMHASPATSGKQEVLAHATGHWRYCLAPEYKSSYKDGITTPMLLIQHTFLIFTSYPVNSTACSISSRRAVAKFLVHHPFTNNLSVRVGCF